MVIAIEIDHSSFKILEEVEGAKIMSEIVHRKVIESKICEFRRKKVMLDEDLAELYGVETKVLNQAVKRNENRFPEDFTMSANNGWNSGTSP